MITCLVVIKLVKLHINMLVVMFYYLSCVSVFNTSSQEQQLMTVMFDSF